jgi:DNA-binding CsgD family transcriptional regulator
MDPEQLSQVLSRVPGFVGLTPAERIEVARIAQGFTCKDSATEANISPETIRARRKRIYRRLGQGGAGELLAMVLRHSLELLAPQRRESPSAQVSG